MEMYVYGLGELIVLKPSCCQKGLTDEQNQDAFTDIETKTIIKCVWNHKRVELDKTI